MKESIKKQKQEKRGGGMTRKCLTNEPHKALVIKPNDPWHEKNKFESFDRQLKIPDNRVSGKNPTSKLMRGSLAPLSPPPKKIGKISNMDKHLI